MAGHTEGGWTVDGFEVYADEDCETHPVADCTPNRSCRLEDEALANARLIAAAPDLLTVAIKSHEPYVGLDEEDIRYLYGADEADRAMALRDAIHRATGDRPEKGGAL